MLTPKITTESKALPGVKITVRRLTQIQRAMRDLDCMEQQVRIAEIQAELDELVKPFRKTDDADEQELPRDVVAKGTRLLNERNALEAAYVKPSTIRAGLIRIEGEGVARNADELIENGPDALIDEVYTEISRASGLTVDERKNSSSPSDSIDPEGGKSE